MLEKRKQLIMSEIISSICNQVNLMGETNIYLDEGWCVYSAEEEMTLYSKCYVDDYPDVDENDEEIFPQFVIDNNLQLVYRDETIQDVVISCLEQKKTVTVNEIMMALEYYEENDNFMSL